MPRTDDNLPPGCTCADIEAAQGEGPVPQLRERIDRRKEVMDAIAPSWPADMSVDGRHLWTTNAEQYLGWLMDYGPVPVTHIPTYGSLGAYVAILTIAGHEIVAAFPAYRRSAK